MTIKPDTDAAHSFGVAMLCSLLVGVTSQGHTKASASLLMAALTHDLAEQFTGDVSAPAKRHLGMRQQLHDLEQQELRKYGLDYEQHLTVVELQALDLADCMDGLLYCCRELSLGNKNVQLVWRKYCSYVEATLTEPAITEAIKQRATTMYHAIQEIYKESSREEGPRFDVYA
jgi:5'-deoxynucleotidase YfbR-like HD superfamily hydrolase